MEVEIEKLLQFVKLFDRGSIALYGEHDHVKPSMYMMVGRFSDKGTANDRVTYTVEDMSHLSDVCTLQDSTGESISDVPCSDICRTITYSKLGGNFRNALENIDALRSTFHLIENYKDEMKTCRIVRDNSKVVASLMSDDYDVADLKKVLALSQSQ